LAKAVSRRRDVAISKLAHHPATQVVDALGTYDFTGDEEFRRH